MEFDVELTPGKVWLLRKTAQACLDNGRPEKALSFLKKGLKRRPDDEDFNIMKAEAEQAIQGKTERSPESRDTNELQQADD